MYSIVYYGTLYVAFCICHLICGILSIAILFIGTLSIGTPYEAFYIWQVDLLGYSDNVGLFFALCGLIIGFCILLICVYGYKGASSNVRYHINVRHHIECACDTYPKRMGGDGTVYGEYPSSYFLLNTYCLLLPTSYSLLTTSYLLLTTYCLLLTTRTRQSMASISSWSQRSRPTRPTCNLAPCDQRPPRDDQLMIQ